jgi:chemotaxis protein histidine kinase CheA
MTFGDGALQREVLQLFDTQAADLSRRLQGTNVVNVRAIVHTLKGAALGIGAMSLADAAKAVERGEAAADGAMLRLAAALAETRAEIARLLASPID